MVVMGDSSVSGAKEEQSPKAQLLRLVIMCVSVSEVKDEHDVKTLSPILVMVGSGSEVKKVQP